MALFYMFRVTISPIIKSYFSRHSAGSTTQNNKTEITYNSTTIALLYY